MVSYNLCSVLSFLQLWSWGWRMEPIAVREEWKWSTKENGAQWMTKIGAWRKQLWCADSWGVELPLMLLEGFILDQGLAPFGFSIFTAKGQSQCSQPVLILFLKTIVLRSFPMTRMLEQSAHVSPAWSWMVSPVGKAPGLISRVNLRLWITAFRTYLGENSTHTVINTLNIRCSKEHKDLFGPGEKVSRPIVTGLSSLCDVS